jgi:hypothetical protein
MAWIALTSAKLQTRIGEDEYDALIAEKGAEAEAKVSEILRQLAQDIVGRVNAGRRKRGLSPAINTGLYIPPGSERHAYTICVRLLTSTFPSLATYNGEDRKEEYENAENHLDDLANNNADSDDAGGDAFTSNSSSSFRYGGAAKMDFITPI